MRAAAFNATGAATSASSWRSYQAFGAVLGTPSTEAWLWARWEEAVIRCRTSVQRKRRCRRNGLSRLINDDPWAYGQRAARRRRSWAGDVRSPCWEYGLLIEVHATGDNFLGGEDFTAALLQACLKDGRTGARQPRRAGPGQPRMRWEQLKRKLGDGPQRLVWSVAELLREWSLDVRAQQIWAPLGWLRAPIDQALR